VTEPTQVSDEQLSRTATRGGLWGVLAETSSRASQSLCFFVLAGVLSPKEFGAAAIAFVVVQIASSLTYAGLGAAVQVLGPDVRRDRTAVGMGLTLGLLAATPLVLLAGPLCDLLGSPGAADLVRLVAIALPLLQVAEVLSALLERELRFRTTGLAVVTASLVSAVVGLALAAAGAGATALVAQAVVQVGGRMLVLAAVRPGALRPALHRKELTQLWSVGKELLLGQVFGTASSNIDNLAVSAIAGAAALGGYGFVYNLSSLPYFLVGLAVGRVALPIYATLKDRPEAVRPAFLTAFEATSWLAALPLGFLAIAGPEALVVIFGHKWDPVAWALRVLALNSWLRTIETTSAGVLIATGEAQVMRRVQQWQFAGVLVLLVPLVLADGPVGAAIAVTLAVTGGTSYSFYRAVQHTGADGRALVRRLSEAAAGGLAGGVAGLLVLQTSDGFGGLLVALLASLAVWGAAFALIRPAMVRAGLSGLQKQTPTADPALEAPVDAREAPVPQATAASARAVVSVEWEEATVAVHPRYTTAQALVHRGNQPLAWVTLPLVDGRADEATVHAAVLAEHPGADLVMPWPAPRTARVSVVVCSTGRTDLLTRSLRSILASDHPAFEVVVVDDNPLSGAARSVVASFADSRLRLVEGPAEGQTEARSRGVVASSGPLIAFTDEDVVVDPGWLSWLTAPLVTGESAVASGLVLPGVLATAEQLADEDRRGPRDLVRQVRHVLDGALDQRSLAFTREALDAITDQDVLVVYEPRAVSWQHT
jgi:O-antigen/teichoic acid export membrane protein